jgi:hypothetical protein
MKRFSGKVLRWIDVMLFTMAVTALYISIFFSLYFLFLASIES